MVSDIKSSGFLGVRLGSSFPDGRNYFCYGALVHKLEEANLIHKLKGLDVSRLQLFRPAIFMPFPSEIVNLAAIDYQFFTHDLGRKARLL